MNFLALNEKETSHIRFSYLNLCWVNSFFNKISDLLWTMNEGALTLLLDS